MKESERIISIFLRLYFGEEVRKKDLAKEYGVSPKTIQRYFSFYRDYVTNLPFIQGELIYNPKSRGFSFKRASLFNKKEVLVLSKILLESRAFNKQENHALIEGLLGLLKPSDQKEVKRIIEAESTSYIPITDQSDRIDKIWEFSEFIRNDRLIEFDYTSPKREGLKVHHALPLSLYFDDHYYYLIAYDLEKEKQLSFRLDRVKKWKFSYKEKPQLSYRDKQKNLDERNSRVDAFTGTLITFHVHYKYDPSFILDQFPNSTIVKKDENGTEIKIISQDSFGLRRTLISQLDGLEVLSPPSLREDIIEIIENMQKKYKK